MATPCRTPGLKCILKCGGLDGIGPLGRSNEMSPSELTADSMLAVIRSPRNTRCTVWTATTLLGKLGIPPG